MDRKMPTQIIRKSMIALKNRYLATLEIVLDGGLSVD
jgi:hypothetical protein